jgi:hypothetical protein
MIDKEFNDRLADRIQQSIIIARTAQLDSKDGRFYIAEIIARIIVHVMDTRIAVVPDNGITDKPRKTVIRSTGKIKSRARRR